MLNRPIFEPVTTPVDLAARVTFLTTLRLFWLCTLTLLSLSVFASSVFAAEDNASVLSTRPEGVFIGKDSAGDEVMIATPPRQPAQQQPQIPYIVPEVQVPYIPQPPRPPYVVPGTGTQVYPGYPGYPGLPGHPNYPTYPNYPGHPNYPGGRPPYPGPGGHPGGYPPPPPPDYPDYPGYPGYPGHPDYPGHPGYYPGHPAHPGYPGHRPPRPPRPMPREQSDLSDVYGMTAQQMADCDLSGLRETRPDQLQPSVVSQTWHGNTDGGATPPPGRNLPDLQPENDPAIPYDVNSGTLVTPPKTQGGRP